MWMRPTQVFLKIFFSIFLFLELRGQCLLGKETDGLPLYYWRQSQFVNFGDYLSLKLLERIVGEPIRIYEKKTGEKKLLAIGSILYFAQEGDLLWGTGINGKKPLKEDYRFDSLDVRAVRGPKTAAFLETTFGIPCPKIYGDPALLVPYFFPEFKRKKEPKYPYIVIPHYSERELFPKNISEEFSERIVYPTDPWDEVIEKITDSAFVISSSLHGIVVAEAFGIPAKFLRITANEPLLKYEDYYEGTGRENFLYAESVQEALDMGGEPLPRCDLKGLYDAFPFEQWPEVEFLQPDFSQTPAFPQKPA